MQRRISYRTRSARQRFRIWQRRYHNAEMVRQAEVLPLHRDMVTLLTFVRDNKVAGTQILSGFIRVSAVGASLGV